MKFCRIIAVFVFLVCNLLLLEVAALPAATTSAPTTHIVSFVHQRKSKSSLNEPFDFDFESVDGNILPNERYIEDEMLPWPDDNRIMDEAVNKSLEMKKLFDNEQDVKTTNHSGIHSRMKQSIPVLEPVRHLINHVRDSGGINHTLIAQKPMQQNESAAIETSTDRESANHSMIFELLDGLGVFGSMIWSACMSVFNFIWASISNASAGSSSFSSGGSSS